jgi:hypothetical protein
MPHEFSDRGIPILSLGEKVDALRYCLEMDIERGGHREDAMGHLFDLIYYIAPGYKFIKFDGIQAIADHYGKHPTPIKD